ncbi:MAG: DUF4384 domain-containing protein [Akkermansia sp.]|nr:DUF4384 domain-containing protein [Akkermansia sp.]
MKAFSIWWCICALCGGILSTHAVEDPFAQLAESLVSKLPKSEQKVRLGVGNFVYGESEMMSPLSVIIREELELALPRFPGVRVITRSNLADLEMEGEFQATDLVEPGSKIKKVTIEGVEGIVRGRFVTDGRRVVLYTEIAWLKGGSIIKDKVSWKLDDVSSHIWSGKSPADVKESIVPQNQEASQCVISEITESKLLNVAHDFSIELRTADGERAYKEGSTISFLVRSTQKCHIAVICHQADGSSVVLFPNKWHEDSLIPADKWIEVPGAVKDGFEIEISEPFGSDVVQVIACTDASSLHKEIKDMASAATEDEPYGVMPRGMVVKKVKKAFVEDKTKAASWSENHIIVSTFPAE